MYRFLQFNGAGDASRLSKVVEVLRQELHEQGYLYIEVCPTLDALIASSILLRVLAPDYSVAVEVTASPRSVNREPVLQLGLDGWKKIKIVKADGSAVEVAVESTLSAACTRIAEELGVVDNACKALSLTASYIEMRDRGENGDLMGLDRSIAEDLVSSGVAKKQMSLKLFGAASRSIKDSITLTLDPFIPGLTGHEDKALKFLESIGVKSLDKKIEDLEDEELAKLGEGLFKYLAKKSRKSREPSELIGIVYSTNIEGLQDIRETALALMIEYDVGGVWRILSASASPLYLRSIHRRLSLMRNNVVKCIEEAILEGEKLSIGGVEAYLVPSEKEGFVSTLGYILSKLGVVDEGTLVVAAEGGEYFTTIQELRRTNTLPSNLQYASIKEHKVYLKAE